MDPAIRLTNPPLEGSFHDGRQEGTELYYRRTPGNLDNLPFLRGTAARLRPVLLKEGGVECGLVARWVPHRSSPCEIRKFILRRAVLAGADTGCSRSWQIRRISAIRAGPQTAVHCGAG